MKDVKVFNKLVRDRIPEIIESNGEKVSTRILNDEEYRQALLDKLIEEAQELKANPSLGEIADVQETLEAILEAFSFNPKEALKVRKEKQRKRGAFKLKIFLEKTYRE